MNELKLTERVKFKVDYSQGLSSQAELIIELTIIHKFGAWKFECYFFRYMLIFRLFAF